MFYFDFFSVWQGTYWMGAGRTYAGGWRRSLRHGVGTELWPNGDRFEGDFKDGKFHGSGTYLTRGGKYVGEFVDGRKEGQGKMTWTKNGHVYEGGWKGGRMHGSGKYTKPDMSLYEGEWKDHKRHGKARRSHRSHRSQNRRAACSTQTVANLGSRAQVRCW